MPRIRFALAPIADAGTRRPFAPDAGIRHPFVGPDARPGHHMSAIEAGYRRPGPFQDEGASQPLAGTRHPFVGPDAGTRKPDIGPAAAAFPVRRLPRTIPMAGWRSPFAAPIGAEAALRNPFVDLDRGWNRPAAGLAAGERCTTLG